jgi:glycosyltransferase involved in cell wall biosynthesis
MGKGTISWFSNSPYAATGYGMQTAQVLKRMVKDGYDVAVLSNFGREGANGEVTVGGKKIPEYARGADLYSNDVTPLNHAHHRSKHPDQKDLLITLYDVWVLKGNKFDELPIASWIPVDHKPIPPLVLDWLKKPNVTPLAMSKYGHELMQGAGVKSFYVPHAIEQVFKPTDRIEGVPNRKFMGLSETDFVVGMNAANKASGLVHRKAFAENLLAFSIFAKDKPDAKLYLHTDMFGSFGGWNLTNLLEAVGLSTEQVVFADQVAYRYGLPQTALAGLYTAMDVYLGASYGEGFGVGTIEAQACGTPVIVSDFAASPELVRDGWLVEGQPLFDPAQLAWFFVPNIPSIVSALEKAYERGRGRSIEAIEGMAEYDADFVYKTNWKPVLVELL